MSNDIRSGRHCVFKLHAHLVFVTKYRKPIFNDHTLSSTRVIFEKVCRGSEVELVELNGEEDHLHLLINYPPKLALSKLVNSLKGVSSRLLRLQHPELRPYYWKDVLWSPSYFVSSCGGAPLNIIREYILNQRKIN